MKRETKETLRDAGLLIAGAIVLAVGVWMFSQPPASYQRDSAHHAREYAEYSEGKVAQACISGTRSQRAQCIDEAAQAARADERSEDDLAAQRTMAWWGAITAAAALMGGLLSLLGVVLVYLTLRATRHANAQARREFARARIDARKAGESAAEQIAIAQDTAYRELRAYISIEQVRVKSFGEFLSGQLIIRNAGKTPAEIRLFLNGCLADHPRDDVSVGPEPVRWKMHSPYINATTSESVDWFYPITGMDQKGIEKLVSDGVGFVVYLYGRIEFVDLMRHSRVLHFAFRNHGAVKDSDWCAMIPCGFGNSYEDGGEEA